MSDSKVQLYNESNRLIIEQIKLLEEDIQEHEQRYLRRKNHIYDKHEFKPAGIKIMNIIKASLANKKKELRSLKSKLTVC